MVQASADGKRNQSARTLDRLWLLAGDGGVAVQPLVRPCNMVVPFNEFLEQPIEMVLVHGSTYEVVSIEIKESASASGATRTVFFGWTTALRYQGLDFFGPESGEATGYLGRGELSPFNHSPDGSLGDAENLRDFPCREETSLPA